MIPESNGCKRANLQAKDCLAILVRENVMIERRNYIQASGACGNIDGSKIVRSQSNHPRKNQ